MPWRWGFVLGVLGTLGCGQEIAYRPLILQLDRLSSRTDMLVVKVFPASEPGAPVCATISLANVQQLATPSPDQTVSWSRSGSEARRLDLPRVDDPSITLVAYGEDVGGSPIQLACADIVYAQLESPDVTLVLSM